MFRSHSAPSGAIVAALDAIVAGLYQRSDAQRLGINQEEFRHWLLEIADKSLSGGVSQKEARQFYEALHVSELVLARACAAGSELAWEEFISRFREKLYSTALHIAKEDTAAHDLADSVYAELFGLRTRDGRRVSKLTSYTGRGSLEGWLRTVLAQQYIDRYRAQKRLVSLDDQITDPPVLPPDLPTAVPSADTRLEAAVDAALTSLEAEERYVLAAYYLDDRTLAEIGQALGLHASSVSRKLDKLAASLSKRIRNELVRQGLTHRQVDEIMEVDVRDLQVNVRQHLTQQRRAQTFCEQKVKAESNADE